MAEINTPAAGHKKGPGVKKGKKLSTRVDLTPEEYKIIQAN